MSISIPVPIFTQRQIISYLSGIIKILLIEIESERTVAKKYGLLYDEGGYKVTSEGGYFIAIG